VTLVDINFSVHHLFASYNVMNENLAFLSCHSFSNENLFFFRRVIGVGVIIVVIEVVEIVVLLRRGALLSSTSV